LKTLLHKIGNIGISENTDFSLATKLRIYNYATVIISLISVFYGVIGIAHQYYLAVAVTVYSILFNFIALVLVKKGFHKVSFHFSMWYAFSFLSAFTFLFGGVNNSYYYFLFVPVACNILFDSLKTTIIYSSLCSVLLIINVHFINNYEAYYSKEQWMLGFSYPNLVFVILLIFLGVRLFKQNNLKYQHDIEEQKKMVEEKNHEITDSINYAKRIQEAILPPTAFIEEHLPQSFILYKPKDIVAGDFYWMEVIEQNNSKLILIAAADCTGHGVPGALVSVVCSNALNRAVNEFSLHSPGEILTKTRELVLETFAKSESDVKDGMDISLLAIHYNAGELTKVIWSGANNPLWYTSKTDEIILKEIKAHKQAIGKTENPSPFPNHEIQLKKGEAVYLITDGFADQFGGEKGKKFKYKSLSDLLVKTQNLSMNEQKNELEKAFNSWKGDLEQVDDVTIMGIRF
jgi:serine phosphatase RsbU (regulator of sigma subunit)